MAPPVHFLTRLAKVEGRVQALCKNHRFKTVKVMEREANTCEAELQYLYDFVVQHEIDISPYYDKIMEIQRDLIDVKVQIESRRRSIWGKVVSFLAGALDLVLNFFGLADFSRRLIGGVRGFLKSGD